MDGTGTYNKSDTVRFFDKSFGFMTEVEDFFLLGVRQGKLLFEGAGGGEGLNKYHNVKEGRFTHKNLFALY